MKKLLNQIRKNKVLTFTLTFLVLVAAVAAKSNVKASSYIYDYWKNVIPSAEGITYKETYYNKDITNASNPNETLQSADILTKTEESVTDMAVYNEKIYLLEVASENVTIPTGTVEMKNVGKLIVINQNFQYEEIVNEFIITDEVKAKLDEFYHFSTPLDEITADQINSSEYVDIYDAANETKTVSANCVIFEEFAYVPSSTSALNLYIDNVLVDSSKYTTEIVEEKVFQTNPENTNEQIEVMVECTKVTFNTPVADGTTVRAAYHSLQKAGRAPYQPSSVDASKACVKLKSPEGITVTADAIYIADTQNARILKLNYNYEVVDVYLTPEDNTFYQMYGSSYETEFGTAYETINVSGNDFYTKLYSGIIFQPQKIAVNKSGVCYCISKNVYQGLIEFNSSAEFNRFLGKNTVTANPLKQLWSNIWTEEQYSSQTLDLPSMFNNIAISSDGYLYATSNPDSDSTTNANLVKVINSKGKDIMVRNGYVTPDGDVVYLATSEERNAILGPSVLTAVAISNTGNFTVCDEKRGRLFTYDTEGNLLYITGEQPGGTASLGSGTGLSNSLVSPIAVDYFYRTNYLGETEETVIVLDQSSKSIVLFETTEFGRAVNTATYLYQNGMISDTYQVDEEGNYVLDEDNNPIVIQAGAETYWRQVIKMNTNYELAYLGIGKALNLRGEYKEAMKYFKLAHSPMYYSKAYTNYRDAVLNENFNLIMTVILVACAGYIVHKVTKKINEKNQKLAMKGDEE